LDGVWAPAATPAEIIERLNRDINAGLTTTDIRARLSDVGTIPMILSAAEFGAFVAAEADKWTKVVKFASIKPE
jgi:tripartite-type tricarboxylate transporter receptor subunit TctC